MNRTVRRALTVAAVVSSLFVSANALASPWTVPKDELSLQLGFDFGFASHEFLPDGTYQRFPLDGKLTSSNLRLSGRYGFTSRLELAAELNVKALSFVADPLIPVLQTCDEDSLELGCIRRDVKSFSDTQLGVADLYLTGRYNLLRGNLAIANEVRVKLPTGYKAPAGTFSDEPTLEIDDDVTLGDGQADLEDSILLGLFIPPTRTFARLDVGFRLRFGGAGHQVIGGARIGQFLGPHVVLFAGGSGAYTVVDGDVIGQTFISTTDGLAAQDVAIGENTIPVDLRLEKDILQVEGGLLLLPAERIEIQAAYSQIVLGANVSAIQTVSLSTVLSFPNLTANAE